MSFLRINTNAPAANAARLLSINTGLVAQSLERLSSGLRINRAGDDPAGLSLAERLQGQYRGLSRASANALEGLSLMQTADSAVNEVMSTLQDIRELAVSASDGTKTAGDRAAIQGEISSYIEQINRLASASEFNTKRLLDGSLGALVSTSDYTKLRGIVTGDVGVGGNFVIQPRVRDAGALQRMQSDVFTVTGAGDQAGPVSALTTLRSGVSIITLTSLGRGRSGIYQVELPDTARGSLALARFLSYGNNATLSLTAATAAGLDAAGVSFAEIFQAEEISGGDYVRFTFNNVSVVTLSIAVSAARDINTWASVALDDAMVAAGLGTARGTAGGRISLALGAGVTLTGATFVDKDHSGSKLNLSFNGSSGTVQSNVWYNAVSLTFRNNGVSFSGSLSKSGANDSVISIGNGSTGAIHVRFDPLANMGAAVSLSDQLRFSDSSGGNNLQDHAHTSISGAVLSNGTYMISATGTRTFAIYAFNNDRYSSLVAAGTDQDTAVLAARGNRFFIDTAPATMVFSIGETLVGEKLDDATNTNRLTGLRLSFNEAILQSGERAVFEMSTSNVVRAGAATTLGSIGSFRSHGVFSSASAGSFDLYFNNRSGKATVQFNSTDTLDDLAGKISLALYTPPVAVGAAAGGLLSNAQILNPLELPRLVTVNAIGTGRGSISIVSARPGDSLIIAGNDKFIAAAGFDTVQAGRAPEYSITAVDALSGAAAGSTITRTDMAYGLIQGVALKFDNSINLRLDPEPPLGNAALRFDWPYITPSETPALSMTAPSASEDLFIHVAPNPLILQIGANYGQTLTAMIPEISARSLGLEGLNVSTQELAGAAIGTVDAAQDKASLTQTRLGAYQNSLKSSIAYLDVAAENTLAAESRIRDVDYADEIIALMRAQVMTASATYALAQANLQPQQVMRLLAA